MLKRLFVFAVLLAGLPAVAQGMNDLIAGKLINPKVGQWVWYDLTDTSGKEKFMVRQAIVGEEKVSGEKAYWVELEIVPELGYRTVYKMLLTGPAGNPKNIHKVLVRREPEPMQEVAIDEALKSIESVPEPARERIGSETVKTTGGPIEAEHYRVESETGRVDLWTNEQIPPTGIVRILSSGGEMTLRGYGEGGASAASAIDAKPDAREPQVTFKAEKKSSKSQKKSSRDTASSPQKKE